MKGIKTIKKEFGDELRAARRAAKLSQEELAFSADLHRTYISLLERGLKSPTLEAFFRICVALGEAPEIFISRLNKRMGESDRDTGKWGKSKEIE
jgi:transcriptional regulator with XRE-family HTH domain